MADTIHPMAAQHLPFFITPPGQTDVLLVAMAVVLVALILGLGVLYFRLHALPEQISHRHNNKSQFEIVAVLALLALFTHNNLFWVAALLLAMVPLPDFSTPLDTMAGALKRMAFSGRGAPAALPAAERPQSPSDPATAARGPDAEA